MQPRTCTNQLACAAPANRVSKRLRLLYRNLGCGPGLGQQDAAERAETQPSPAFGREPIELADGSRFEPWQRRLEIVAGEHQTLTDIELVPARGRLVVTTEPPGAQVLIGEVYAGVRRNDSDNEDHDYRGQGLANQVIREQCMFEALEGEKSHWFRFMDVLIEGCIK